MSTYFRGDVHGFGQAAYEAWGKGPAWNTLAQTVQDAWDASARAAIGDFIETVCDECSGDIAALEFRDLRGMAGLSPDGDEDEPDRIDPERAEYERLRAKYERPPVVSAGDAVGFVGTSITRMPVIFSGFASRKS